MSLFKKRVGLRKVKRWKRWFKTPECFHPEHYPPGDYENYEPGDYKYTCPKCGRTISFEVTELYQLKLKLDKEWEKVKKEHFARISSEQMIKMIEKENAKNQYANMPSGNGLDG